MGDKLTIEVTGSTKDQRDLLKESIGLSNLRWEYLDSQTFNMIVEDNSVDEATDQLDDWGLLWHVV